jgi:hypothetical protein
MTFVIAFAIYLAVSTVTLAATLCIVCDRHDNPFMRGERAASWLRCLGLVFVVTLIGLVPTLFGELLAVVCWFGGIMFLFGLGFCRTLVITGCNVALGFVTFYAVERMLLSPSAITVPVIILVGLAGWCTWRRIQRSEPPPSCPVCGADLPGHADLLSSCPDCGADLDLVHRDIAWRTSVRRTMLNHEHERRERPFDRSSAGPHRPRQRPAVGAGPRVPGR